MPFGAEIGADGQVRFRLWAPAAKRVELLLWGESGAPRFVDDPARTAGVIRQVCPMQSAADGWFELLTREAGVGSLYQYRIDGSHVVPDPGSRRNPHDVHGPSEVIDPLAFDWHDGHWHGRPWHEAVLYELHVGTFTPEGTFAAAEARLGHLEKLGVTVIEFMPIADFPGRRGWGYDGVLAFAPEAAYGTPGELKSLIAAAHRRGIAVMLDVVYNHFGPEGNYLGLYAPQFFSNRHQTPWGAAVNFDGDGSRFVREFFINNALYWLEEYHFDGLRFDAVHAIFDDTGRHILTEVAQAARTRAHDRHILLVLENGANQASFLGPPGGSRTFDAQWNDDVHHCLHTILTGESDGYYVDFTEHPHAKLCRSLAEGFVYQGEFSQHAGAARGEPSAHLPPTAFVIFLQNHDQIGNRARGERLGHIVQNKQALRAAIAVMLLAPSPPLLFMGEEWAAGQPFPYFCDFEPDLAAKVRAGRKQEFARFARFGSPQESAAIADPTCAATFESARLDWSQVGAAGHEEWLDHYRRLLVIRQRDIVPRIPEIRFASCSELETNGAFAVDWTLADGSVLHLLANLTAHPVPVVGRAHGRMLFATHPDIRSALSRNELAPWSVTWLLEHGLAGS